MGTVADLDLARTRRMRRLAAAIEHAPLHPALRWAVAGDQAAHRRVRGGRTACGAGDLTGELAGPGTQACVRCYPAQRTGT